MLNHTEIQILRQALEETPLDRWAYYVGDNNEPIDEEWLTALDEKLDKMEWGR